MIKLQRLTLKNFAVVSSANVDFDDGLTIITGETGAGKSLIVGAISLLMGERGRSEYLRSGATHAAIEGTFCGDFRPLKAILSEEDIEIGEDEFTITRELHADGKNRCLINDQRVGLGLLKKLGERIGDLHGQHQHQWLLEPERHLWFLDRYAGCGEDYQSFRAALDSYRAAKARLDLLTRKLADAREKHALQRFQLDEIDKAALHLGEEEELETEQKQLENVLRIKTALQAVVDAIEQDGGAAALTTEMLRQLRGIGDAFAPAAEFTKELESVKISFAETARSLSTAIVQLAENPLRLEQIGERLAEIYKLKRKYGGSVAATLEFAAEIRSQLDSGVELQTEHRSLIAQLDPLRRDALNAANRLQQSRETAAVKLAKAMKKQLGELGLTKAEFGVQFAMNNSGDEIEFDGVFSRLADHGPQTAEFSFNANIGETPKPLAQVASGGEISRVMLALKSLIAGNDRVDLLVFDEIDSGIGGETALLVGRKLRELARKQQVIAITHLQQIASFADTHLKAIKREIKGRVESELIPLSRDERIVELGRMISGGAFGEVERKAAEKLLRQAAE